MYNILINIGLDAYCIARDTSRMYIIPITDTVHSSIQPILLVVLLAVIVCCPLQVSYCLIGNPINVWSVPPKGECRTVGIKKRHIVSRLSAYASKHIVCCARHMPHIHTQERAAPLEVGIPHSDFFWPSALTCNTWNFAPLTARESCGGYTQPGPAHPTRA